jgi:hypothetical protein
MADNQEIAPSFNFGIEDTIMGQGSTELIKDLFATETATASPDDIEDNIPAKEEPAKPAASPKPSKEETSEETEKPDAGKNIQDFLMGDDDEEETPITKTPKATKPTETVEEPEDDDVEGTKFSALANDLFKLNVFTKDEDEEDAVINTPEEFLQRFETEKEKGAIDKINNFIGQFGEDYQKAFDAIFVKGADPKDYFTAYNKIQNFSELDLTQEANQIQVIKQALQDNGYESEDIETEIERLKNYGDLETVSQKHHKVLVKKEASKLQSITEQAAIEQQQKLAYKQQYVNNVHTVLQDKLKTKDFDGIPLNPKLAQEVQDFLLVDKYKLPSGETITDFDKTILELKNPTNHATKVKVALLLKILEKDPTLSTIQKAGITKKTNTLFSETARQVTKEATKNPKQTSWFQ